MQNSTNNPIIVALDVDSSMKALALVRKLKVTGCAFKIGFQLFCIGGPKLVDRIVSHHVRVFLDLKFHDIPNTVAASAAVATKMGVWMFNVHTSGGPEMMRAAVSSAKITADKHQLPCPLVIGVTVLTSLDDLSFMSITKPISDQVLHLAQLSKALGLDGVVASAQEAALIREQCGAEFCVVTPGIRPLDGKSDDQKRTLSPAQAIASGSHYLVIGRPITQASRPLKTIDSILSSLR